MGTSLVFRLAESDWVGRWRPLCGSRRLRGEEREQAADADAGVEQRDHLLRRNADLLSEAHELASSKRDASLSSLHWLASVRCGRCGVAM